MNMNSVLMDVLKIGGCLVLAGILVGVHIAAVWERKELKSRCDVYKRRGELAIAKDSEVYSVKQIGGFVYERPAPTTSRPTERVGDDRA